MSSIFIYHHLGLGDHIVCNGLVRELVERHKPDIAYVLTKIHNMNNVSAMYADDLRIVCLETDKEESPKTFRRQMALADYRYRVGFERCNPMAWDRSFYECANLSFETRWSSFKVNRVIEREKKIESLMNPTGEPFVLVHDTSSMGTYPLDIKTDYKIIRMMPVSTPDGWRDTLIDWCSMIEQAKEIHCLDSSFIHLCASIRKTGTYHNVKETGHAFRFTLPAGWKEVQGVKR